MFVESDAALKTINPTFADPTPCPAHFFVTVLSCNGD